MRKKSLIKRLSVCAMALAITCTGLFAGCGGNSNQLVLDLGSLMPTSNTTPTADNPEVIQASKYIMEEYVQMKGYSDDYYIFAKEYGRNAGATQEEMTSWYNQQINSGNCPIIGMTSLNMFQDLDYYIHLDEYLDRVNPYYGDGTTKWRDTFYDYVWEDSSIQNRKGEVVAIPLILGVGSLTGTFYNKTKFETYGFKVPTEWSEFTSLMEKCSSKGMRSFQPYTAETKPTLFSWSFQYSINYNVLEWMGSSEAKNTDYYIDYDNDGKITDMEVLRATYEGKFNPTKNGPARMVYEEAIDFYMNSLPTGWASYDYTLNWNSGSLAMYNRGLWDIPIENSNAARKSTGGFDYGIFPTPIAGKKTFSKYCKDVEYYDSFDEVKSPTSVALNILKPAVLNSDGSLNQEKIDAAVDILMWLTTAENNNRIAQEKGGTMGAVKGTSYNKTTVDGEGLNWTSNKFPKINYSATWPTGYVTEFSGKMNDAFAKYVLGTKGYSINNLMTDLNSYQQQGVDAIIQRMNIDTTGWVRG